LSGEIAALIGRAVTKARARYPGRPALIGVGGAQGSGKSYQCRAYAEAHPRVAHFSLDDVYLTRAERMARAAERLAALPPHQASPALRALFLTRGPPGTHDLRLADETIAKLALPKRTALPRFDKRADERTPTESWPTFLGPANAVLVDGWCLGAMSGWPGIARNAVESEDVAVTASERLTPWRDSIREALDSAYARFFDQFDTIIYLQAPSWRIVRQWRGQQEEEILGRALTEAENEALDRFVMHYESVTCDQLEGWSTANVIVHLDEARNVIRVEEN